MWYYGPDLDLKTIKNFLKDQTSQSNHVQYVDQQLGNVIKFTQALFIIAVSSGVGIYYDPFFENIVIRSVGLVIFTVLAYIYHNAIIQVSLIKNACCIDCKQKLFNLLKCSGYNFEVHRKKK